MNGEAKLNAAKQEANTALGQLNNLNNAQRQNLQSQINGAHQIQRQLIRLSKMQLT